MNKGVIYKIACNEDKIKYCIRLDRNVMIDNVEYNIYIKDDKTAKLFNCSGEFETGLNISHLLGKKLEFTLSFKDDEGNEDKKDKIISIEEKLISNDK